MFVDSARTCVNNYSEPILVLVHSCHHQLRSPILIILSTHRFVLYIAKILIKNLNKALTRK